MELKKYKTILNAGLLITAGVLYWSRIFIYIRLIPFLKPESDSIGIPLFAEGLLLIVVVAVFLAAHHIIGKRIFNRNITQVRNLYVAPMLATLRGASIGLLFPIILSVSAGVNVFCVWEEVGFGCVDVVSFLCLVAYLIGFSNYWMNSCGVIGGGNLQL